MTSSACACSATNTFQNEIDEVLVAASDLQNLAYMQQLLLSERMQDSCERDALFTLHYAFRDRLEALQKSCGHIFEAYSASTTTRRFPEYAKEQVAQPQPKNTPVPFPDKAGS
ncbi:hypothetical protein [Pseudovibrio brasiliensis]|uniref:Uncharacterized protein n=1 Tax=Pseudovibrio brasiliensis TaxID=1898042 RepID=A0ABX8AQ60_9HYPH|nr:hypothetical protein [Pseudovibrio brasiliensis]QUS57173.1 hypothetical protein KGB56_07220 [Pseudovibrio brasiliensis]